jgi:hypothetical protein
MKRMGFAIAMVVEVTIGWSLVWCAQRMFFGLHNVGSRVYVVMMCLCKDDEGCFAEWLSDYVGHRNIGPPTCSPAF